MAVQRRSQRRCRPSSRTRTRCWSSRRWSGKRAGGTTPTISAPPWASTASARPARRCPAAGAGSSPSKPGPASAWRWPSPRSPATPPARRTWRTSVPPATSTRSCGATPPTGAPWNACGRRACVCRTLLCGTGWCSVGGGSAPAWARSWGRGAWRRWTTRCTMRCGAARTRAGMRGSATARWDAGRGTSASGVCACFPVRKIWSCERRRTS
mmetsp:Transcript_7844/g.16366  ORF Transcript_7844/g.16366 Transcript_7844/m.16366 type:complete len:211 (+) Transcript_7844:271-903(+)